MSTRPITVKSANSGAFGAESPDFIVAEAKDRETYIPPIEFATASNFVRFGSAKEYYEQSIKRIYEQYPYDGSQKEKTDFHLSSSYLDRWLFDTKYPKFSGYADFSGSSYIQVNRGYQEATTPASTKLSKLFNSKNVTNDTSKRRKQTVDLNFDEGVMLETRMKHGVIGAGNANDREYLFYVSSSTGHSLLISLLNDSNSPIIIQGSGSDSMFSANATHSLVSSNFTTSNITDNQWHHYGFNLYHKILDGVSTMFCDFYYDGVLENSQDLSSYIHTGDKIGNFSGNQTLFIGYGVHMSFLPPGIGGGGP